MQRTHISATPPERQAVVQLPDGRRLAWSEWGPADGLPVLFCTGAGLSGWLGFGAGHVGDLGVRLIAIDRPGLGRSDPHPAKTLSTWADDVREFIQAERLWTPVAVGFSQGAPFAFALAGRRLVQAVAIVSGQDQLSHPRLKPLLHPDVAAMLAAVHQDAERFEHHMSEIATAEGMWRLVVEMSGDYDRDLYHGAAFRRAFERALQEGFSQGARGYARDLVNALGPWPVEPEEIDIPVDLWYGGQDTSTVHSPDFGTILASRVRNGSHFLLPEEGGSILWTRARDILARLSLHTAELAS